MPWTHLHFWIMPLIIAGILGTLSALASRKHLHKVYREQFQNPRRERLFLASVGFFIAVAVVRGITLAIHYGVGPFHDVSLKGRHIHHLVWGILLLLLTGYGWLLEAGTASAWVGRLLSMTYGVASALALDEFALWLNLKDVYWAREGRESFEAMGIFGALLALGVFGGPFFRGAVREIAYLITRKKPA
jgi:hypothetical protein